MSRDDDSQRKHLRIAGQARRALEKGRARLGTAAPLEALQALERAAELAQSLQDDETEGAAREGIAQALLICGWPEEAHIELKWAFHKAESLGDEAALNRLEVLRGGIVLAESEPVLYAQIREARAEYGVADLQAAVRRLDYLRKRVPDPLMILLARIELFRARIWVLLRELREARAAVARASKWAKDSGDLDFRDLAERVRGWVKSPPVVTDLARAVFFIRHQRPQDALKDLKGWFDQPWPDEAPVSEVEFHLGVAFAYRMAGRTADAKIWADKAAHGAFVHGRPSLERRAEVVMKGQARINNVYQGWTP